MEEVKEASQTKKEMERDDTIVIADLKLLSFIPDAAPSECSVSQSLSRHLQSRRRKSTQSLQSHLEQWIELNNQSITKIPSPALQAAIYLYNHPNQFKPLNIDLIPYDNDEENTVKLFITLPRSALPEAHHDPRQILKPNPVLQSVLWHVNRFDRFKLAPRDDIDIKTSPCGFIGCDAACCPQPNSPSQKRLDFHLDRIFEKQSLSQSTTTPPTPSIYKNISSKSQLLLLPEEILHKIAISLHPADLTTLSSCSPVVEHLLLHVIPCLRLRLFPHQVNALRKMISMESLQKIEEQMPSLHIVKIPPPSNLVVDLVNGAFLWLSNGIPCVSPPNGGLFCDQPGLGKTITALALVLKTLGRIPRVPQGAKGIEIRKGFWVFREPFVRRFETYGQSLLDVPERRERLLPNEFRRRSRDSLRNVQHTDFLGIGLSKSVPSRNRRHSRSSNSNGTPTTVIIGKYINGNDDIDSKDDDEIDEEIDDDDEIIILSAATLIVVPTVLTPHWMSQIYDHVDYRQLRILFVYSKYDVPSSASILARNYDIVVAPFDVIREYFSSLRDSAPVLLRVLFYRLIVDEGHSLSSTPTSTVQSDFTSVCSRLRAQCRWVMTGTPTPRTLHTSDVDYLHSLLRFIRDEAYGLDKKAWDAGIRLPYSEFKIESIEKLGKILGRVMIRANKSILKVKCRVRNVILDFSEASATSYNGLVRIVRRNLITSDWFSSDHLESLLHKRNIKEARSVFTNLKLACCAGGTMAISFGEKDVCETLDVLYDEYLQWGNLQEKNRFTDPTFDLHLLKATTIDLENDEDRKKMETLQQSKKLHEQLLNDGKQFTRLPRYKKNGQYERAIYCGRLHEIAEAFLSGSTPCQECHKTTAVPMVTPCAHIVCDECIVKDRTKCIVSTCGKPYRMDKNYIPENLLELQPSASSNDWILDWYSTESAKVNYVINRIENLPKLEEWEQNGSTKPTRKTPKVIVHSEYGEHLKYVMLKMKQSPLKDKFVEMSKNTSDYTDYLKGKTASQVAIESIERFRNDDNISVLLMNSRHGAVGLDLSFVQYVFLLEPVWDRAVELQIVSRAHRIGCKHDILVERLAMRDSVEHAMLKSLKGYVDGDTDTDTDTDNGDGEVNEDERGEEIKNVYDIQVSGVARDRAKRDQRRKAHLFRKLKIVKIGQDEEAEVQTEGENYEATVEKEDNVENATAENVAEEASSVQESPTTSTKKRAQPADISDRGQAEVKVKRKLNNVIVKNEEAENVADVTEEASSSRESQTTSTSVVEAKLNREMHEITVGKVKDEEIEELKVETVETVVEAGNEASSSQHQRERDVK